MKCVRVCVNNKVFVMLRNHLNYSTWDKYYEWCWRVDNALASTDLHIRQRPTLLTPWLLKVKHLHFKRDLEEKGI